MRAAPALVAVLALLLAGCGTDVVETPPVVSDARLTVHRSRDGRAVATDLPAAFGDGFRLALVATPFDGAEPTLGVTSDGTVLALAFETIVRSQDLGHSWQPVHVIRDQGDNRDPYLWVDPEAGRAFAVHIHPARHCRTLAVSDDDGETWSETPMVCPTTDVDHQKLASGPMAGPLPGAYPRLVSLCYNHLSSTRCAMSRDGGLTFLQDVLVDDVPSGGLPLPLAIAPLGDCGGLNGVQHHAGDGTIYLPYGFACQEARVAVSTDGGLTWARRDLGVVQRELDPEVATTPDGTAYYLFRGEDQRMQLLRSHDGFATVEGPFVVSPPDVKGAAFAGLVAGADGRIAYAFLGNRETNKGPDDAGAATEWHLFVGLSLDADGPDPTFVTQQATPSNDPVQRGSIALARGEKDGNRNLLDFIDMVRAPDGRVWVAFTDGCTSAACRIPDQLDAQTSRDQTLSVAYLAEGPSLFGGRVRAA
ncbi:MAG: hypothetical protein QOD77_45 [Thermoplasmata archaeon]|nr:hypothetical protein [Thermoplasmata archaeon]